MKQVKRNKNKVWRKTYGKAFRVVGITIGGVHLPDVICGSVSIRSYL